ncbi:MAG TPA: RidA family protein [Acidimicrobiales bacterium]|nr:RidA family protein [Acidimicrobiales bacterium]
MGPYTPLVCAGPWIVCSGQLGLGSDGFVEGGVGPQTTQAILNLAGLLQTQGATLFDVIKTTVFLADISDYSQMNAAYVEAFAGHAPARSAVGVSGLPLGALVEIEAWAYRD